MKKIQRLAAKAIADNGALVVGVINDRGHYKYTLLLPSGAQRMLIVSGSPKNLDQALDNAGKDVKRLVTEDLISYPLCA